jgi:hypothetical protein
VAPWKWRVVRKYKGRQQEEGCVHDVKTDIAKVSLCGMRSWSYQDTYRKGIPEAPLLLLENGERAENPNVSEDHGKKEKERKEPS